MALPPKYLRDWATKDELKEDLASEDPVVAMALAQALTASINSGDLPATLPTGVRNVLPPVGKIVIAVTCTQAEYDSIPNKAAYGHVLFAIKG